MEFNIKKKHDALSKENGKSEHTLTHPHLCLMFWSKLTSSSKCIITQPAPKTLLSVFLTFSDQILVCVKFLVQYIRF